MHKLPKAILRVLLVALAVTVAAMAHARPGVHVKLKASADGKFLVGKPAVKIKGPRKVTIHLKRGGKHHARLVGMGPGRVFRPGAKAGRFKLHVKGPGGHFKAGPGGVKVKGHKGHKGHKGFKFKGWR